MSNPQKENGYTGVANEILEQIMKVNLNGTQFRIVMAVWRFTYGFQRKDHEMSLSFIATAIDAHRRQVDRELAALIERNILSVVEMGPRKSRVMSFNKRYDEWTSCIPKKEEKNKKDTVPPAPAKVKKMASPNKKKYENDNTYFRMANYFHKRVSAVAEAEGLNHLIIRADLQKWADDMRKIVEIDKINKYLVKEVMDWVTTDAFWKTNVLSAKKLREKFGELAIKMKSSQKPTQSTTSVKEDPRDREIAFQKWVTEGNDPDEFNWN